MNNSNLLDVDNVRRFDHEDNAEGSFTRVLVGGDGPRLWPVVDALRGYGYDVVYCPLDRVRHHLVSPNTPAPPEVLVLDASGVALERVEAIRDADWALPMIVLSDGPDGGLAAAAEALAIDAVIDDPDDVDAVCDGVSRLAPPVFDVAS